MFTLPALAVGCKPNEQLELVPAEPSVETKIATITEPSADAFDWSRDDFDCGRGTAEHCDLSQ